MSKMLQLLREYCRKNQIIITINTCKTIVIIVVKTHTSRNVYLNKKGMEANLLNRNNG